VPIVGYTLLAAVNFKTMNLDDMDLPKVNQRKQESKMKQTSLRLEIYNTIEKFEKDNGYKFEPYEVDNILLEMVKRNHESYLNTKFGYDTV
jgi:coproporphyrinogen III oxidase-like Fe-S oxidoreductase